MDSRTLASKGYTAPTWPTAYGGGGLSSEQARVLNQELSAGGYRGALVSFGLMMLGPVLLEYGTEAQKSEYLPKIVAGEIRWCQGYSEPGAGSDLASLQTRCEDKGDHWLINGQKIWTSYANKADWCFCLVRTDTSKKHEGISFVLIDMATPGVETRPIKLISGESPFCETFFTDVKIPKDNLVGRVNGGWEIAKRLLQYERQNISGGFGAGTGAAGGASGDLGQIAKRYVGLDETGAVADADLRGRITRNKMDFQAFYLTLARLAAQVASGQWPQRRHLDRQIRRRHSGPGTLGADDRGDGLPGGRLGGRGLQPRRTAGDPGLAAFEGQLDRGRHLGGQRQRGGQAGAWLARSEVARGSKFNGGW